MMALHLRFPGRWMIATAILIPTTIAGIVPTAIADVANVTYRWSGHHLSGGINAFAVSHDGKAIVSADRGNYIRVHLMSPDNPFTLKYYFRHTATVQSLAVSPDGMYFALGDVGNHISLYELWTGRRVWSFFTGDRTVALQFSEDGTRVLWATRFGRIGAISLVGQSIWSRSQGVPVHRAAWSQDGLYVATLANKDINVFDARNGDRRLLIDISEFSNTLDIGYGARNQLYAVTHQGVIWKWDVDGTVAEPQVIRQPGWIRSMALAPNGTDLLLGYDSGELRIVNRDTGVLVRESAPFGFRLDNVRYFSDGPRAAASGTTDGVQIFDLSTMTLVDDLSAMGSAFTSLAWESNGRRIHIGDAGNIGAIASGSFYRVLSLQNEASPVTAVAWSPTRDLIARGLDNGDIRIRRTSDWALMETLRNVSSVTDLEFSSGGTAMVSSSHDGDVSVFTGPNYSTRRTIMNLGIGGPNSVAFRPNGAHIAVGSGFNRIHLNRFIDGVNVFTSPVLLRSVRRVRFSPDSQYLAAIYGPNLDVYRIQDSPIFSMTRLYTVRNVAAFIDVAFTPDSHRLVAVNRGGTDGQLSVHESATGALVRTLEGFPGLPIEIAYSPRQDSIGIIHEGGWLSVIGDPASAWLTSVEPSNFGPIGGSTFMVQLFLSAPAGPTGAFIGVSVPAGSPVQVPSAVFVRPFAQGATLFASTTAVSVPTEVTITGTFRNRTTTRTVTVFPPGVESLVAATVSFPGGTTVPVTVRLTGPAPVGGTLVTLTRSGPILRSRSTVRVPAGGRRVTFNMGSTVTPSTQQAWIQARTGHALRYLWVNVTP